MISLNVTITGGIALKLGRKEQAQVNEAIALDLQDNLRTRFEDRGGRSFWADAARATVVEPDGNDRLAVRVYKRGVRHQWLGSIKALGGPLRASGRPSEVTGEPTQKSGHPDGVCPVWVEHPAGRAGGKPGVCALQGACNGGAGWRQRRSHHEGTAQGADPACGRSTKPDFLHPDAGGHHTGTPGCDAR